MRNASALLGIGESMCDAYAARYNRKFLPFQNCIDTRLWISGGRASRRQAGTFTIGYTGRIGTANATTLGVLARAVASLSASGFPARMRLALTASDQTALSGLKDLAGVEVLPRLPHADMPAFLSSCDALLLPLDFDRGSREFARYSMPSKLPEYLASGTPILVVAPPDVAVTEYVVKRHCALVVDALSRESFEEAIQRLMDDASLGRALGAAAVQVARTEHDAAGVRNRFRKVLALASGRTSDG